MIEQEDLFGSAGQDLEESSVAEPSLPDGMVQQLREALDRRGLNTMDERRLTVEALAHRPVASLRDLSLAEARVILMRLQATGAAAPASGSAWDNREEETWIDRL